MLHLLLIEDDLIDQKNFQRLVEHDALPYQYKIASRLEEAAQLLKENNFDVILADYMLGDGTIMDIFPLVENTPIIVITGIGSEEIAVEAMKAGAYDYLTKDQHRHYLKMLPIHIENVLSRWQTEQIAQAQKQIMAATAERERIARDIHTTLSQTLFSIQISTEALLRLARRQPNMLESGLEDLQKLTQQAVVEMQTMLMELKPQELMLTDFKRLLERLVEALMGQTSIAYEVYIENPRSLPVSVKLALYRITQEALTNIIKHARAQNVWVKVFQSTSETTLEIQDNGRGFDASLPGVLESPGLQLINLRAIQINAVCQLQTEQSHGTIIRIICPT